MIKVRIFNGLLNVLSFLFLFVSTFVSAHAQTEQESESEILADAELDPSSRDLIAEQPKVLGLGFGASEAWQRFSGTFLFCFHEDFCSDTALGGGRFVLNRETDAKDFRLRIDSRSVVTSLRYFLPIRLPVFSQTGFGLALLHIDAKPSGGVEDGDDASTRLRFGGNAEALFLSQQFGFQVLSTNRMNFEMSLIGFARAWVHGISFTNSAPGARDLIRKSLEETHSWGVINFRIGYRI